VGHDLAALFVRQRELLERHLPDWLPTALAEDKRCGWCCRRGLLRLSLARHGFPFQPLTELARSEAGAWVEELSLWGCDDTDAERVARCPLLAHVHTLAVCDRRMTPEGLQDLLGSRHLAGLSALRLTFAPPRDRTLD